MSSYEPEKSKRKAYALTSHFSWRWRRTRRDIFKDHIKSHPRAFTICTSHLIAKLSQRGLSWAMLPSVVQRSLDHAADQQLYRHQWRQKHNDRCSAIAALNDLKRQLCRLKANLSRLPRPDLAKLNAVLVSERLVNFDSDLLIDLTKALAEALCRLPGRRAAKAAYKVIYKPVRLRGVGRQTRSDLIDLWESMPPMIRGAVEAEIRASQPPETWVSLLEMLLKLLDDNFPEAQRPPVVTENFARHLATILRSVGLSVGSAYDGTNGCNRQGLFQQLGRAALLAFGDRSEISRYTVRKIKATDPTLD